MSDFVTAATYDNYLEAEIYKNKLENSGIHCYIADGNSVTMQWHLNMAMGGIKLRVREEDLSRAIEVINDKSSALAADFEVQDSELECPSCGSNNTSREKFSKRLAGISIMIGLPVHWNPMNKCRCFHCGHRWNQPRPS